MDLESRGLIDDRLEELQDLLPKAFSESGIDFDKLRILLGDEVDEELKHYVFMRPGKTDAVRQS